MKYFHLAIPRTKIDDNNATLSHLFDQLQNIEELVLYSNFYYFNLDNFVNLKKLLLRGNIRDGFNFELLKNLYNQLDDLSIYIHNIDYKTIFKLLNGHTFSNLKCVCLKSSNIKRLEKRFFEHFPNLQIFYMTKCKLEIIDDDEFSNSQGLIILDLEDNLLKSLNKQIFSKLINLERFIMNKNRLESIDNGIFSHMNKLKFINLNDNRLVIRNLKEAFDCEETVDIRIKNNI